jgi:SAM-dependent methyltransferase
MPRCRECRFLDPSKPECTARVLKERSSPIRKCDMVVVAKTGLEASGMVLEIGPGVCQAFRRCIWRKGEGSQWVGVDPNFDDRPLKGKYKGKASDIPFGDEAFDVVAAFQSMEHWGSYGDTVSSGVSEVLRVLKPGGLFVATVPMHSHGGRMFVVGDVGGIMGEFADPRWESVGFEEWRRDHDPLPPAPPEEEEIRELRKVRPLPLPVSQWMLEIRAVKV